MKQYGRAALWLLVLLVGLVGMDRLMRRDDGKIRYDVFFEDQAGFDVCLLGNSHVLDGIYPIELWRDYGITAFNFGNTNEPMTNTYWTLRLLKGYHKPKVAVIDVSYIDRTQETEIYRYRFAHDFLDQVPLTMEKIRAVYSLFPQGKRQEFLFQLSLYHARWEEYIGGKPELYMNVEPCMFGAELRAGRHEPAEYVRTQEIAAQEAAGEQALCDIIELCLDEGIMPVLTVVPFPATQENQMNINRAQLVARRYGVDFVNLLDVPDLVDFDTDCYDAASHLNPDGATKVTAYLGRWMSENCGLEDHRGDARYAHWDAALEDYRELRREKWSAMSLID
ncbi:MAG: hypothetical protein E7321_09700 [Clostridiales bacterium]|nr:hypothetical protein [Clostridiales bacterium]